MTTQTIRAADVRPGDRIYNSHSYHPTAAWVRVVEATPCTITVKTEFGSRVPAAGIAIHTTGWTLTEHADAGVAVQRD